MAPPEYGESELDQREDTEGKVVVLKRGKDSLFGHGLTSKAQLAHAWGAVAVIVVNSQKGPSWSWSQQRAHFQRNTGQ